MSKSMSKEMVRLIGSANKKGTSPYDTQAEVVRVEGNTAWVHIPGGVDETPVRMTMNANPGDMVQVRVSGGLTRVRRRKYSMVCFYSRHENVCLRNL